MQVSPALPWEGNEQQGGTITLQVPVTRQQLLDGAVIFGLSYHGDVQSVIAQSAPGSVVIHGDGAEYQVTNVIADNVEYSELVLVKMQPTTDGLVSVERVQPLQYVDPTRVYSFVAFKGYLFMVDRTSDKVAICDNDGGGLAWAVTEYGQLANTAMPLTKNDLGSELAALYNNLYSTQLSFDTSYEDGHAEIDEPVFRIPDTVSVRTLHSLPWSAQSSDSVLRLPADCSASDILANKVKFFVGDSQSISAADVVSEGFNIALKVNGQTVYTMPKWSGLASEVAISHNAESNAYLYLARLADAVIVEAAVVTTNNVSAFIGTLANGQKCEIKINGNYPVCVDDDGSFYFTIQNENFNINSMVAGLGSLSPLILTAGSKKTSFVDADYPSLVVIDEHVGTIHLSFGDSNSDMITSFWQDEEDPTVITNGLLPITNVNGRLYYTRCNVNPALPWSNDAYAQGEITLNGEIDFDLLGNYLKIIIKDDSNNFYVADSQREDVSGTVVNWDFGKVSNEAVCNIPREGELGRLSLRQLANKTYIPIYVLQAS